MNQKVKSMKVGCISIKVNTNTYRGRSECVVLNEDTIRVADLENT